MAMEKAIKTPWPKVESSMDHIFSHDVDVKSKDFETTPNFSGKDDVPMALARNKTLKSEIEKNPFIRMFGEDVADFSEFGKLEDDSLKGKGGVFSISKGVQRVAFKGQVFNLVTLPKSKGCKTNNNRHHLFFFEIRFV